MTSARGARKPAGHSSTARRILALCRAAAQTAQVDGGGVTVIAGDGTRIALSGTDVAAILIEDLQLTLGHGPCVDAVSSRAPVLVNDLVDPLDHHARLWPSFHDEVIRMGVRALFAFPLGSASTPVGTLDLYRRTPGALSDAALDASLSAAEDLGALLLRADPEGLAQISPVHELSLHRAAGMVMVQMGTHIDEALVRLRATAYAEGVPIGELAWDVEHGRRRFVKGRG